MGASSPESEELSGCQATQATEAEQERELERDRECQVIEPFRVTNDYSTVAT